MFGVLKCALHWAYFGVHNSLVWSLSTSSNGNTLYGPAKVQFCCQKLHAWILPSCSHLSQGSLLHPSASSCASWCILPSFPILALDSRWPTLLTPPWPASPPMDRAMPMVCVTPSLPCSHLPLSILVNPAYDRDFLIGFSWLYALNAHATLMHAHFGCKCLTMLWCGFITFICSIYVASALSSVPCMSQKLLPFAPLKSAHYHDYAAKTT